MLTFETENIAPEAYDAFVGGHPQGSLLQSSTWAMVKSEWQSLLTAVYRGGEMVGAGLVLIRTLPLGIRMWYLPKGPVLDYADEELLNFYLTGLKELARQKKATVLKIAPPVLRQRFKVSERGEDAADVSELSQRVDRLMRDQGCIHQGFLPEMHSTIQPRFEAVKDLSDPLADSLPNHAKRYMRDCDKQNVRPVRGDSGDLDDFYYLIGHTEERQNIRLRSREYFQRILDHYGDQCLLYLSRLPIKETIELRRQTVAEVEANIERLGDRAPKRVPMYQKQLASNQKHIDYLQERLAVDGDTAVLSGVLSVVFGRHCEMLYAGTNSNYLNIPSQIGNYVATMEEALAQGAETAGMGGIEGTLDDGLTRFKLNFDPQIEEFLGEYDYVVKPLRAWILKRGVPFAQTLLRKVRRRSG